MSQRPGFRDTFTCILCGKVHHNLTDLRRHNAQTGHAIEWAKAQGVTVKEAKNGRP